MKKAREFPIWYLGTAGLCSLFIGIGLCRFAYTPLIPALIHQSWLSKADAGYLGTINFVGYLLGAIFAKRISEKMGTSVLIRTSLILSIVSLALCAIDWGFIWLAIWRFLAGVTGAILMVMTLSVILKNVPNHYRGRVSGATFAGMGLGVVVSGLLFPELAKLSIAIAWLSIALLAVIAVIIAWPAFSFSLKDLPKHTSATIPTSSNLSAQQSRTITLLSIAYALFAIAHKILLGISWKNYLG